MNERHVRPVGRPQYARPASRQSRRSPQRRLPHLPTRYVLFALAIVLFLFGLYRVFAVNVITVISPSRSQEIKSEAMAIKQGSMRQGNLILLDAAKYEANLKAADPLILNVQVKRKWLHTLVITVNLKQPGLGWTTGNQSYLVDRDGTVIDILPQGTGLPVILDDSNLPVKVGQRIVSTKFVSFVSEIMPKIIANGMKPTKAEVRETTIDLYVTTDKGYQLIFDTSRSAGDEAADLHAVMTTLTTQKKTPAAYIDLRIPNKAYYK